MKATLTFFILHILTVVPVTAQVCTLSWQTVSDLTFGDVELPSTGNLSVTIDPVSDSRSSSPANSSLVSGPYSTLYAHLTGPGTTGYTVTATFPASLTDSGSGSLTFDGKWAWAATVSGAYQEITSTSHTVPTPSQGQEASVVFRFGGTVSDIDATDSLGDYEGEITISAECTT